MIEERNIRQWRNEAQMFLFHDFGLLRAEDVDKSTEPGRIQSVKSACSFIRFWSIVVCRLLAWIWSRRLRRWSVEGTCSSGYSAQQSPVAVTRCKNWGNFFRTLVKQWPPSYPLYNYMLVRYLKCAQVSLFTGFLTHGSEYRIALKNVLNESSGFMAIKSLKCAHLSLFMRFQIHGTE